MYTLYNIFHVKMCIHFLGHSVFYLFNIVFIFFVLVLVIFIDFVYERVHKVLL
jgi:hypothetical protein